MLLLRIFRIIDRAVRGGESWHAAWEAIKTELKENWPGLVPWIGSAAMTAWTWLSGPELPWAILAGLVAFAALSVVKALNDIRHSGTAWSSAQLTAGSSSAALGSVDPANPSGGPSLQAETTAPQRRVGARQTTDLIHHKDERIELYKLVNSEHPAIENRVFENCEIIGPVVFLPKLVFFNGRTIFRGSSDINQALIEVPPGRAPIAGVIEMRNCTFADCAFQNVAMISDPPFLETFRAMFNKK